MTVPLPHAERRWILDRRRCPTSFWSSLRWGGRRRGFRRAGEGESRYVDRLSPRVFLLALFVFLLSVLDAVFTLLHLEEGAIEANPLMEVALRRGGPAVFLGIKTWITGLGVLFLAAHQNFRLSRIGLRAIAVVYMCLSSYHFLLWAARS